MTLLDDGTWNGKLFLDGWTTGGARRPRGRRAGHRRRARSDRAGRRRRTSRAPRPAPPRRSATGRGRPTRRAPRSCGGPATCGRSTRTRSSGWIVRETGAIPPKARLETWFAASVCHDAAGLTSLPYGELLPTNEPHLSMTRRVPIGVVGVISPFNFPLILSIRAVAPALALGNAVDPQAGPADVGRRRRRPGPDLRGGRPAGRPVQRPARRRRRRRGARRPTRRVGLISFTGSTRAGRIVGALAAEHLKRVHLELGGNSALIVLDDVDVEKAVSVGAFGSFMHQGQICMTTGRHLVARSIADRYVDDAGRARRPPAGRRPGDGPGGPRPDHRRAPARPHPRAGHGVGRGRRAARRGRHVRGPVLPADRPGRRARLDAPA